MELFQDDSFLAVFFGQPIVIWTFIIGAIIIFGAVTFAPLLNFIQNRNQKRSDRDARRLAPALNTLEIERALEALEEDSIEFDLEEELDQTGGTRSPVVNKFEAISESDEKAAVIKLDTSDGGAAGAQEINKKESETEAPPSEDDGLLAEIFQDEVIIDPLLQAMCNNLNPVDIDSLIEDVSTTLAQLKALAERSDSPPA